MRNCRSAADGLNQGIARAKHDMVVCVHQDVYLPAGWPERFWQQYEFAQELLGAGLLTPPSDGPKVSRAGGDLRSGRCHGQETVTQQQETVTPRAEAERQRIGVAGVYGIVRRGAFISRAGRVVDRDHILKESQPLPAVADTLDELLLAIPKDRAGSFDPALGFHFYGADYCLRCGSPSVILDALCFHNSVHVGVSPQFHESARLFTAKWSKRLPLVTPSAVIDVRETVSVA
jgi:hypothetical protein